MIWTPKKPHLILPGDEDYQPPGNCFLMPHRAMMGAAGGGIEANFYQDIVTAGLTSGLKLCLDAGSITSVAVGSQQDWVDLSGNIGADQFHRGATDGSSTDDPTHVGTPGDLGSVHYSFDGGDYLKYGATTEGWMDDMHQASALFSLLLWYYHITNGGDQFLVATINAGTDGIWFASNANKLRFKAFGSGTVSNPGQSDTAPTGGAWNLVGITIDDAGGESDPISLDTELA